MNKVIQQRFESYNCQNEDAEKNAIKEITQEIALSSLYHAGFFTKAAFMGGTALRILHGLNRFSEDMDFTLINPDPDFVIGPYITKLVENMESYGYRIRISGRDHANSTVKSRFIKEDSVVNIVSFEHVKNFQWTISIKIEIDINPPAGGATEIKLVEFPDDFNVRAHDLPSLFGGKCNALLTREYVKGRDWYDFAWYIAHKTPVNYQLLSNSLAQFKYLKSEETAVNKDFVISQFAKKISSINWNEAKNDVRRFLLPVEAKNVDDLWSKEFFLEKLQKLKAYL